MAITVSVNADCCGCPITGYCNDGTTCGYIPNLCCGWGQCNFFCCNCDGGCRSSSEHKQNSCNGSDFLSRLDEDSSGEADLQELDNFIEKNETPRNTLIYSIFTLLDVNGDGHITDKEFNAANLK